MKYDTAGFFRLRKAVRSYTSTDGLPIATIEALAALHAAADAAVRSSDRTAFVALCWQTWDVLAKVPSSVSALALPPCFRTTQLEEQFEWAAIHLLNLETRGRPIGDHAIYSGVKGTGKTTFLLCIGVIAAVLLDKTVPIYWSYEHRDGPASTAAATEASATAAAALTSAVPDHASGAAASDSAGHAPPTPQALLRHASSIVRGAEEPLCADAPGDILSVHAEFLRAAGAEMQFPLLLLDDFTELYCTDTGGSTERSHMMRARCAGIMTDVHWVCKNKYDVFCLMAASRTDMEYYMHPERSGHDVLGYPTLNNSIFKRRQVNPLRDAATLERYVAARYGAVEMDGKQLLDATGGVGRDIDAVVTKLRTHPDVRTRDIVASPDLFALHCAVLARVPHGVQAESHWPVVGMAERDAVDVLVRRGHSEASAKRKITQWCDDMVFFRTESMLEVLVPGRLREFNRLVAATAHLRAAQVLAMTVHGFDGGDSGKSNESLICEYIHTVLGVARSSNATLKLDGGTATLAELEPAPATAAGAATGGAGTQAPLGVARSLRLRAVALQDILDCVLRWQLGGKEIGIDRVWLTLLEGTATVEPLVNIDMLQLKTGKVVVVGGFRKGTLTSERARPSVSVSKDAFAGILVKAERGLATLLPALHACFPHVTWQLGTCWVFSTQPMAHAAAGFAEENPDDSAMFRIRESECETIRGGTGGKVAGPLAFSWQVKDGIEWVRAILPEAAKALL